MLTRTKPLLAGLAAAMTILIGVAGASARNIRVSEPNYEVGFPFRFEAAGNNISCPSIVFLGGFRERTFAKTQRSQVDRIRHISVATQTCTGGTMTILTETMPWEVDYEGFSGRLPGITAIRTSLIGMAFRVTPTGGTTCLVRTTETKPAFAEFLVGTAGRVEGYRFDETIGIPLGGGFLCELAGEGHVSGTGEVRDLPRLNNLVYTLI